MEHPAILSLFDQKMRIEITFPTGHKEILPGDGPPEVVRFIMPPPRMNFIQYARLPAQGTEAAIRQQIAYFRTHYPSQGFTWNVYTHDNPPDLLQHLKRLGFVEDDDPGAIMVLDLDHTPPELLAPLQADVRPITDRAGLEDIIQVEEAVWNANFAWMRDRYGSELEIPGYLNMYAAYVDGRPACAAWIYFYPNNPFAGLYGGSTLEAYRNRGLYTALLAARVQAARQRGVRYLMVDAMDASRPILARRGFQTISGSLPMVFQQPLDLQPPAVDQQPKPAAP